MSEVFGYVKPPLEELRDLLPGTDGFDFSAIASCAAEKRRLNPDYQPSLAELKAVDAVLIAQAREAAMSSHPDTFTVELTEAQRSALSFAALCEAESLARCREKANPEVREAVRNLWEARRILEGSSA